MLSERLGVSCRPEGKDERRMVGVVAGETWVGRKVDYRGKTYVREIVDGRNRGWDIVYLNQDGWERVCTSTTFQKWVEQWDARPVTK